MKTTSSPAVTLLLGGARSGKSRRAQELAARYSRVAYVATAQALDDEMREKIARHKADRPSSWKTVEVPIDLPEALVASAEWAEVLIVDCITVWVSNLMNHSANCDRGTVLAHGDRLCQTLQSLPCDALVVSNETGLGIVPAFEAGRLYRDLLGEINQKLARVADTVLLMVAGQVLTIKQPSAKAALW